MLQLMMTLSVVVLIVASQKGEALCPPWYNKDNK